MKCLLQFLLIFLTQLSLSIQECIPSKVNPQACMCNSTHCDDVPPIAWCPKDGKINLYVTSDGGDRFKRSVAYFHPSWESSSAIFTITVDPCKTYQKIMGFGGAMTDATAMMISCLSEGAKINLMRSYFHCEKGIAYGLMRTPLAGSDYSEKFYTYDDGLRPDPELRRFALNEMDTKYKIPLIKLAHTISCKTIRLKAATWNSPQWMTTLRSDNITQLLSDNLPLEMIPYVVPLIPPGYATIDKFCLKPEYLRTWALYIVKAIKAYKSLGVNIDFISGGNEIVLLGCWQPDTYKHWIVKYLCPEIKKAGLDVVLLALDDQTPFLQKFSRILEDLAASSCIQGFATHSYLDFIPDISNAIQKEFCSKYPEQILLSTEFCICKHEGSAYYDTSDWDKAERYCVDIMNKLLSCSQGYIDWNMALNSEGGPNYINNFCYSPIEVDCTADEFYKKYLFYLLGHFSKVIPEGSIRIKATVEISPFIKIANLKPLLVVAFIVEPLFCSRENIVANILNQNDFDVKVNFCIKDYKCAIIDLPKRSVTSTVSLKPWNKIFC